MLSPFRVLFPQMNSHILNRRKYISECKDGAKRRQPNSHMRDTNVHRIKSVYPVLLYMDSN